jgi:zinc transport system substrate-binding protein
MYVKSVIVAALMVFLTNTGLFAQEKLQVFVSILPQKYFVERIAGDLAEVDVLVTPGKSPATYSPTPAQVKTLAGADVYFRIGVPFENGFMHKIASIAPDTRVVDTRTGILLRDMEDHIHEEDHHEAHSHGHEDGHSPDTAMSHDDHKTDDHHNADGDHKADDGHGDHGHAHDSKADHDKHGQKHGQADMGAGKDPHIWMSPVRVKQQAATMTDVLIELAPAQKERFRKNFDAFARDLDRLHEQLKNTLAPLAGQNLFVFHPAFGYLADDYGLNQIPVETMGRSPKGKELSAIIKLAKQEKARVIFVQPQFDRQAALKIAEAIDGAVVSINPLAQDYLDNMTLMADTIAAALTQ